MSIESSSASTTTSAKPVAGPNHRAGKAAGKPDTANDAGAGGFSALMGQLSASEPASDSLAPDVLTTPAVDVPVDVAIGAAGTFIPNVPVTQVAYAQATTNLVASDALSSNTTGADLALLAGVGNAGAVGDVADKLIPNLPPAQVPPAQSAINLIAPKSQPTNAISAAAATDATGADVSLLAGLAKAGVAGGLAGEFIPNMPLAQVASAQEATNLVAKSSLVSGATQGSRAFSRLDASRLGAGSTDQMTAGQVAGQVAGQTAADAKAQLQVDALLGHRSAVQSQTLSAVQLALREVKPVLLAMPQTAPLDVASVLAAAGVSESLLRPAERSSGKSSGGAAGSGFEAVFGQATVATGQTATVYEIAAPSATVPESGVAETVSYWVTHGVQSAELTLDGFGADPVEVRISINGDQAQIDFRTDQADVRQLLAGAATQLKELLSGEGLQLAGVSVGDSGKGNTPGDDQQPRPGTKRVAQVTAPVMMPAVSSRANLAVGQSLDMFV